MSIDKELLNSLLFDWEKLKIEELKIKKKRVLKYSEENLKLEKDYSITHFKYNINLIKRPEYRIKMNIKKYIGIESRKSYSRIRTIYIPKDYLIEFYYEIFNLKDFKLTEKKVKPENANFDIRYFKYNNGSQRRSLLEDKEIQKLYRKIFQILKEYDEMYSLGTKYEDIFKIEFSNYLKETFSNNLYIAYKDMISLYEIAKNYPKSGIFKKEFFINHKFDFMNLAIPYSLSSTLDRTELLSLMKDFGITLNSFATLLKEKKFLKEDLLFLNIKDTYSQEIAIKTFDLTLSEISSLDYKISDAFIIRNIELNEEELLEKIQSIISIINDPILVLKMIKKESLYKLLDSRLALLLALS